MNSSLHHLASTIESIPPILTSTNLTTLSLQLVILASDLSNHSALPDVILPKMREGLTCGAEYALAAVEANNPSSPSIDFNKTGVVLTESFKTVLRLAGEQNLTFPWTIDGYTICILLGIGLVGKVIKDIELRPSNVEKVRQTGLLNEQAMITLESAKCILVYPIRSMISEINGLILITGALIFQMVAWRCFAFNVYNVDYSTFVCINVSVKLVFIQYIINFFLSDIGWENIIQHLLAVSILILAQFAVYHQKNIAALFFTQWFMAVFTTEQSTYLGMALYHRACAFKLHGTDSLSLYRAFLRGAWLFLTITKWTEFPLKLTFSGISIYWIVIMWTQNHGQDLHWSVNAITGLFVVHLFAQLLICDSLIPIPRHIWFELEGGVPQLNDPKLNRGPLTRLFHHQYGAHKFTLVPHHEDVIPDYAVAQYPPQQVPLPGEFKRMTQIQHETPIPDSQIDQVLMPYPSDQEPPYQNPGHSPPPDPLHRNPGHSPPPDPLHRNPFTEVKDVTESAQDHDTIPLIPKTNNYSGRNRSLM